MNCLRFGILIPFSISVALLILCFFSSLQLPIHASPSPFPFDVLLPSLAPLWLVVFPPALLWIIIFSFQQHSPPLHPFALSMFPENVVPQLHLPPILQ